MRSSRASTVLAFTSTLSCSAAEQNPEPFVGEWVYVDGAMMGVCEKQAASESLEGREVAMSRIGEDKLQFSAGSACKFELIVRGDRASTRSGTCETTVSDATAVGQFHSFSLDFADGLLRHSATGTAEIRTATATLTCTSFEYVDALLARK